jgi:hypothetical protein
LRGVACDVAGSEPVIGYVRDVASWQDGTVPNFDMFERLLRDALVSQSDAGRTARAREIAALNEASKPRVVKRRSANEVEAFLGRAAVALERHLGGTPDLSTSNANRIGKDLYDTRTGKHVELKSGTMKTDANLGVASIAWALGDDDPAALKTIMTGSMVERRAIALAVPDDRSGDIIEAIENSKTATMDAVAQYFRGRLAVGAGRPSAQAT